NYAGTILAPHVLAQAGRPGSADDGPAPFFFHRKPTALPFGAVRYAGLHLYRAALRAQDWWQKA
ncbi:MAG: hypothetical protein ACYTAO_18895, partial [Planctomycetota bacterium]